MPLPSAPFPWQFPRRLAAQRNIQLDGWRAYAVAGVMWVHWTPPAWHEHVPFEIGLFYFLTLTGFLLTRILLRSREDRENGAVRWRARTYLDFEKRRMTRILVPCYAAMLFAIAVGAPDIRAHPLAYFGHWVNFHMAYLESWPFGTAHYWTLALQVQFYLFWPFVVLLVPRRWLTAVFLGCVALGPLTRFVTAGWFPEIHHSEAITTSAMDYFAIGALLSLALERGMAPGDKRLGKWAWVAFAGYAPLYISYQLGHPVRGLMYFQQTLLSVAFAGVISASLAGFRGWRGKALEHPAVQHVAKLSFGLYLFHTPVPMFLGWVLPWLWLPIFDNPGGQVLRMAAYLPTAWGLAYLCWRYLESQPPMASRRVVSDPPDR